jgi:outer membrane protein assembly factor BamB
MSGDTGDFHKAYSTPLIVHYQGHDQVVVPGAQWVASYDPADGHEIWRLRHGDGFSNVPRPVVTNDLVCICTGYMQPQLIAIRLDGHSDVTSSHVAWKVTKSVPTMPSPVVVGENVYFVNDQGVATCASTKSGDVVWTKRMGGNFSASPLAAAGRIYFCNREGDTTVIRPGKSYDELAVNKLDGQHMASPAVIDESLLLRTHTHLYRIGPKIR